MAWSPSTLIRKMIEYVKLRRLTPKKAARIMAKCCECGAFNPVRAEMLLEMIQEGGMFDPGKTGRSVTFTRRGKMKKFCRSVVMFLVVLFGRRRGGERFRCKRLSGETHHGGRRLQRGRRQRYLRAHDDRCRRKGQTAPQAARRRKQAGRKRRDRLRLCGRQEEGSLLPGHGHPLFSDHAVDRQHALQAEGFHPDRQFRLRRVHAHRECRFEIQIDQRGHRRRQGQPEEDHHGRDGPGRRRFHRLLPDRESGGRPVQLRRLQRRR